VLHHFPDQLTAWYSRVAYHLRSGGSYIRLDHMLPDSAHPQQRWLDDLLQAATSVTSKSEQAEQDRLRWMAHLRRDWQLFLPAVCHLNALQRAGLHVRKFVTYRDQSILWLLKF